MKKKNKKAILWLLVPLGILILWVVLEIRANPNFISDFWYKPYITLNTKIALLVLTEFFFIFSSPLIPIIVQSKYAEL